VAQLHRLIQRWEAIKAQSQYITGPPYEWPKFLQQRLNHEHIDGGIIEIGATAAIILKSNGVERMFPERLFITALHPRFA
jgi:hypothetical protein